jgi:hypothetical protein
MALHVNICTVHFAFIFVIAHVHPVDCKSLQRAFGAISALTIDATALFTGGFGRIVYFGDSVAILDVIIDQFL